jgi:hypothetical protein
MTSDRTKQFRRFLQWHIPNTTYVGRRIRRRSPKNRILPLRPSASEFFVVGPNLIKKAKQISRLPKRTKATIRRAGRSGLESDTHQFGIIPHDAGYGIRRIDKGVFMDFDVLCILGRPILLPSTRLAPLFVDACSPRATSLFSWLADE